jgi:hypothetical protein
MWAGGKHYHQVPKNPPFDMTLVWRHNGRRTPIRHLVIMGPLKLIKSHLRSWPVPAQIVIPPLTFTIDPAGYHQPPRPHITGYWRTFVDARKRHFNGEILGFQHRRVHVVGHKPDRMNGFQRSCWGAASFAWLQGYFPDWDPLLRRPNEQDILDGEPFYAGPFPQTPR